MHCPRCGQLQISADTKFCSKCGFQLDLVAEVLAHGGTLPEFAGRDAKIPLLNKKNGVFFSIFWFVFFTMFLTSVGGIMGIDELAGLTAVTGVFGSVLILIFSLAFLPSTKKLAGRTYSQQMDPGMRKFEAPGAVPQLNAQEARSASSYTAPHGGWRAPDTGELMTPGSVTDGTTRLLIKEEDR